MLPTFRLMVVAVAAVFMVLMVAARGLVGAPDAVTRVGEVPMVGRTLVQLSLVPFDEAQRGLRLASLQLEAEQAAAAGLSDPADPSRESAEEATSAPLPLVAADDRGAAVKAEQVRSADPLGDLIRAVMPETPDPSAVREAAVETPPAASAEGRPADPAARPAVAAVDPAAAGAVVKEKPAAAKRTVRSTPRKKKIVRAVTRETERSVRPVSHRVVRAAPAPVAGSQAGADGYQTQPYQGFPFFGPPYQPAQQPAPTQIRR